MISSAVSRRTAPRVALGLVSIGLLGAAISVVVATGASWWWVAGTAMAPDIALLAGVGRGLEPSRLHPRAVPLYNALHHPAGPMALAALAVASLGAGPGAAALAWGFHIAMDRAAGYGLRTRAGFQRS
ncbi:MAG: DUF4260 family protein [Thermoleophilia bacterium]|nr:DUF4260 family protein [Thermoleophilia bacterium]